MVRKKQKIELTPYAVLLVRPTDTDDTIRARFHMLCATEHPDRTKGAPGPNWYALVAAYNAINTAARREAHSAAMHRLSGLCAACHGSGVVWRRIGKAKLTLCAQCDGHGRS